MYVNYVLNCLFELDFTLFGKRKLIEITYKHAGGIIYDFFWETNYRFFYDFLETFPEEYHLGHCYGVSKNSNDPSEISI